MLAENSLIQKQENLFILPEKDGSIFLEPESGGFAWLNSELLLVFQQLSRPQTFAGLKKTITTLHPDGLSAFLQELHKKGLIRINGRSYPGRPLLKEKAENNFTYLIEFSAACPLSCRDCEYAGKAFVPWQENQLKSLCSQIQKTQVDHLSLFFTGGETLLALSQLQELIELLKQSAPQKNFKLLIATPLAKLEAADLKFFKENQAELLINLEAPLTIKKPQKEPAGSKARFDNLAKVRKARIPFAVAVKVYQPRELPELLAFFLKEGVNQLKLQPCFTNPELLLEFAGELLSCTDLIIRHYKENNAPLHIYDLKFWVKNILNPGQNSPCHSSPCGAGSSFQYLSRDLKVYPCRELRAPKFCLGRVDEIPSVASLKACSPILQELLNRSINKLPRCKICPFKVFCGGSCAGRAYSAFNQLLRESPECAFYQKIFPALLAKLAGEGGGGETLAEVLGVKKG